MGHTPARARSQTSRPARTCPVPTRPCVRVREPARTALPPRSDLKPFTARLAEYLVLAKVRQALGLGKCRKSFYGAAPMTAETQRFFLGLNIHLYSGYGLSETSGPHFMSSPCNYRLYRYA